jgi:hypothetical protein
MIVKQYTIKKMTPTESAYCAGYIDADGSISVAFTGFRKIKVNITSSDKSLIDKFCKLTGFNNVYERSTKNSTIRNFKNNKVYFSKPAWEWHLSAKEPTLAFLEQILPYLITKKYRAEIAIEELKKRTGYSHPSK